MPVPTYRAPKDSKPYGLLGYLKDFISPPGYQPRGPFGARTAAAGEMPQTGRAPTDAELMQQGYGFGVREYDPLEKGIRPAGTVQPGSRITGLTRSGEVDRTQSDTYKQYAQTPGGQFERYFKTPEMDQYFGAASRGATAPKDVEAMQALAGQTVAPGKTPEELSAFYRAESAMGRAQMPQIRKGLGYAKGSDLAKWAEANPMLAQRLYAKEMGKREAAGQATPGTTYAGAAPQPLGDESFSVVANAVPAPWNTQGAKVSEEFAGVVPFQVAKTTGEGMPAFQTTLGERAEQLISAIKRDRGML